MISLFDALLCFLFGAYQVESAIMYDAVFVYAIGLQTLDMSHRVEATNLSCGAEQAWPQGGSLVNYLNSVSASNVQLRKWTDCGRKKHTSGRDSSD